MTISSPALIDIGANLSHSAFDHDRETVLAQAREVGVEHILVTGTDLDSVTRGRQLCAQYPGYLSLTAGFHPHVASQLDDSAFRSLQELAALPEVVAVGETGLDYNRNYSPPAQQEEAFARQLELACELGKPVFLHQRDAHDAFYTILREYRPRLVGGVVHCFTDTRQALYDYLDLELYVGVTGWICDERRGTELQTLVKDIPGERLLLETDAPYLLPRTLSPAPGSRRNEPRYLVEVLTMVARCCQQDSAALAMQTTANARRLFRLPG